MNENKIPYLSDDVNKGPDGAFEDKNGKIYLGIISQFI